MSENKKNIPVKVPVAFSKRHVYVCDSGQKTFFEVPPRNPGFHH